MDKSIDRIFYKVELEIELVIDENDDSGSVADIIDDYIPIIVKDVNNNIKNIRLVDYIQLYSKTIYK